jgi:hypothetical protein
MFLDRRGGEAERDRSRKKRRSEMGLGFRV